jgi:hypothetical protein
MTWTKIKEKTFRNIRYDVVDVIAMLRDNATGEVVEYSTEEWMESGEETPSVFNWEMNNYSCDCNRRIFFRDVKGVECPNREDIPCSDGLFSVNLKNALTGEIYYKEF